MIVQDHLLQYEYYRIQGSNASHIGTPDLWVEAYNVETAAKIAIIAESSTGDALPMDIECIAEIQSSGNDSKIVLNQKRNPLILKRSFVPLLNKEHNGEIIDGAKQHPTVYVYDRPDRNIMFESDYIIGPPFVPYGWCVKVSN